MRVRILGSAAGGAFPQWNCGCMNCQAVRRGDSRGKPRSQTQLAITGDGQQWLLLGASPDLRMQIESTPNLHPRAGSRQSPISGVLLANADLDHVLGLLLLRELQPLHVYATQSVRRILTEDNSMFRMLHRVANQVSWVDFRPGEEFSLAEMQDQRSAIRCQPIALNPHYPAYVSAERQSQLVSDEASMGFIIRSSSGKRLAFFPAVPRIDQPLLGQLDSCDLILFDGTFWSEDELIRVQGSGPTAREMGHLPVHETLERLAELRRPRKMFLHINNTNPMLDETSREYRQVREAGWEVAEDGWLFDL